MKMLDFNAIKQPTWEVRLKDDAKTVVHLCAPSVDLLERLQATIPQMKEIIAAKDGRSIRQAFELIADLMNCNEDGFEFTAEDLLTKYKMNMLELLQFAAGYMEFIKELQNAKN
jgi:hypothetical protein